MTLDRTKTSGAGKHVGKLQAFVMRGISLSGFDLGRLRLQAVGGRHHQV